MKRKKQWFAVILAALLAVGQGIVSAAPAESTEEAVTAEADESALQEETEAQTEEQPESASAAASEKNQEITEKQGVKEAKVSQEIGGGYFQKKEIIPLRC
ncbi:hypothetical protein [Anaerostipes caccae]|uniref:hypothetical protein n=1 Tax=Anaerostipes caccae TaxID=105841 RepID=UPI0038D3AB5B